MEDVLVFSETYEEHVQLVGALFERAAANNIAINTEKIVFAQSSVIFGGYVVDATGFRTPSLLKPSAISLHLKT